MRNLGYTDLALIFRFFFLFLLYTQTHIPQSRKPAYRWLGSTAISEDKFVAAPAILCDRNEPKKRVFGTEITNFNAKRSKTDCSKDRKHYGDENTCNENEQQQCDSKSAVKSFVSAPLAPAGTSRKNNVGNNHTQRLEDLETLSSTHKLQYCNHGKQNNNFLLYLYVTVLLPMRFLVLCVFVFLTFIKKLVGIY